MSSRPAFFLLACSLAVLLVSLLTGGYCLAQEGLSRGSEKWPEGDRISIRDLIENLEHYDGKVVVIEGEVVGDVMRRRGGAWITVNDDPYSERSLEEGGEFAGVTNIGIGVWIGLDMAEQIQVTGGYKSKGDRVRVVGVFHRVCREHGGDTDIHAVSLEVLEKGRPIRHALHWWKLLLAAFLSGVALILWRWRGIRRPKEIEQKLDLG